MSNSMKIADKIWQWGSRTFIMGILNVTPDSFSDGGNYCDIDAALTHAIKMADEGADIIDIGGQSTRPGFTPVSTDEEVRRVLPVIRLLSERLSRPISIDTFNASTAALAVEAGANMINDIWGLKKDPDMASVAASLGVPICLMHNRDNTDYNDIMTDILSELSESITLALKAGVKDENIIIDPGIGFGKTWKQNIIVLQNLELFKKLSFPILLGASRKSFIGKTLGLDVNDRLEGTLAVTAAGIMKGTDIVRVHDVLQNARVAAMTDRIVRS